MKNGPGLLMKSMLIRQIKIHTDKTTAIERFKVFSFTKNMRVFAKPIVALSAAIGNKIDKNR